MHERSGNKFLVKQFPDLHKSEDVLAATIKVSRKNLGHQNPNSFNKEERVNIYLDRIKKLFIDPDERARKRNIKLVASKLFEDIVISEDNFPDAYLENEQKLAKERGHGHIEITQELKRKAIGFVQNDQKASYSRWLDYFSSDDAPYPTWFKYYVLRGVSKLLPYDKVSGKFHKRSKSSTKIFPEINREALAFVYEAMDTDETSDIDQQLKSLLVGGNFAKLYGYAVETQLSQSIEAKEKRKSIKGSWKLFEQYDETKLDESEANLRTLVDSIQGMGTGWCTVGEEMARSQLEGGDFYVFYSRDDNEQDTVPRVAIRMEHGEVAEVRGVNPDQELEPELIDTAREKFVELPGGDRYEKKVLDMKRLTKLEEMISKNEELTVDDLRFLYELDSLIEGFGYTNDPRIKKLQSQRDIDIDYNRLFIKTTDIELKIREGKELTREELIYLYGVERLFNPSKDVEDKRLKNNKMFVKNKKKLLELSQEREIRAEEIASIFGISTEEVATKKEGAGEKTKIYVGKIFPGIKNLQNLEHIYISFPDSELITTEVRTKANSSQELLDIVNNSSNVGITKAYGESTQRDIEGTILNLKVFKSEKSIINEVCIMTSEQLGLTPFFGERFEQGGLEAVFDRIESLGLEVCPPEIALEYAIQNIGKIPSGTKFYLGKDPVERPNKTPGYLKLEFFNTNIIVDFYGVPRGSNFCNNYVVRIPVI
ncbi:hypothetical protein KA111_00595 [Candidatus Woesebacteria bacterium]|nr:hypothetical protein [Candidatus Woesebacteria bacterium]